MDVVVVESPTKAKTITKYVGGRYAVLASNGHVRDLPEKDGSVLPDDGFAMRWQVMARIAEEPLLGSSARSGTRRMLYLATARTAKGEAISWHVCAALPKRPFSRMSTSSVVSRGSPRPRSTKRSAPARSRSGADRRLSRRRALDYLVGFTLSPALWRKLPAPARRAGSSVALRLICEREARSRSSDRANTGRSRRVDDRAIRRP